MWHPFDGISTPALSWLLALLGAASGAMLIRLESMGRRLRTSVAPLGVVSLEMALSAEEGRQIIDSWDQEGQDEARRKVAFDYWFIPLYTTALAILGVLAARWFAEKSLIWMSGVALALAWGQWVVGLFDFVQNSALLRMLQMHPEVPDGLVRLVGSCARLKILLIMMAIISTIFVAATLLQ